MKAVVPVALTFGALFLASCTVGPKYAKPSVPMTPAYKEPPPDSFKEAGVWKPAQPADHQIRPKWWEIFGDPQLNALEEQIDAENQDLRVFEARFREARAAIQFNRSAQYPTISTGPSIGVVRPSANRPNFPAGLARTSGDFVLPFDISYEVDLWGRIRRSIAAAQQGTQASAADLETAKLSIHAELALNYFELRSLDAQRKLLEDTVKAYTEALQLTENRFNGGVAAKAEVAQARTQLETTRVQATDVGVQRSQYEHAIAILLGKPPAAFSIPPSPLNLQPPAIPVGIPAELLERRPDIAAAERRVAQANEQIGIARAAFFPSLVISAMGGLEGSSILNWFNWPSRMWAAGPSMAQTIFDAGRRQAISEQALANYDATAAGYRQTTLSAFQQVEDNLAALRILSQEAQQQRDAVTSARESLELFTNRYKGGVDTYLQVITAQTITLSNERNEVDILRRRMAASVLLIKALGGGWDLATLPKQATLR